MKNTKVKMLAGAAWCLLTFADPGAAEPRDDIYGRASAAMDKYYEKPHSPDTFRALTGMGDPVFDDREARSRYFPDWSEPANRTQLKLLIPSFDLSQSYFLPEFGDCRMDGPMMTLKARAAALGANHPYVKQWVLAERAVLTRCGGTKTATLDLPPEMATSDPAIARLQTQDRAYQQAAMLFYQDTNAALEAFQKIAADKTSADRPLAVYMVLAIHAGSKASEKDNTAALSPADAVAEIHAAMADPSLVQIHAMAAALIGYIGATVADGPARHAQIAEALEALHTPTEILVADSVARTRYIDAQETIPFIFGEGFWDGERIPGWVLTGKVPDGYTASAALADLAKTDPMAAWIGFPRNPFTRGPWAVGEQIPYPDAARHYLDAHSGTETRNPWVHENPATPVAVRATLTDEESARLLANPTDVQAAAALSIDFPELIRREIMEGGLAGETDALRRLRTFPFSVSSVYGDARSHTLTYLITRDRLAAARKLRDMLKLESVASAGDADALILLAEDEDHLVKAVAATDSFDHSLLNSLSIAELWRLAGRGEFKRGDRATFARSAWSREYALGRIIGKEHDGLMRELNPEITKSWRSQVGHEVTPDDHQVLADVLASPGMNITLDNFSRAPGGSFDGEHGPLTGIDIFNHNDNNWWCGWETKLRDKQRDDVVRITFGVYRYNDYFPAVASQLEPVLRASFIDRMTDRGELAALSRVDCAPKMLALRTIAWVKHPGWFDSRDVQAEALANVVLATRYGCDRQGSHRDYSQKAFTLLHVKFGETPAAKRTRYWFP